ncbi:uncharacterized protein SPSK_10001 [Sporothrix schenckii 1099-18]|uniref:Uncharacterized protein n=1 Tax=Sporothrix schenckii 1099-18 TaxID=1397361 RepID=A0A0F2M7G2_SPOSC|nr:uncharacterized protein SPSK_10001 [Sporothrix schenckii 1099-18]KJR85633.1 hypothetical protein SPSK_10001 [Sporothrix schenckii 1099-18]
MTRRETAKTKRYAQKHQTGRRTQMHKSTNAQMHDRTRYQGTGALLVLRYLVLEDAENTIESASTPFKKMDEKRWKWRADKCGRRSKPGPWSDVPCRSAQKQRSWDVSTDWLAENRSKWWCRGSGCSWFAWRTREKKEKNE